MTMRSMEILLLVGAFLCSYSTLVKSESDGELGNGADSPAGQTSGSGSDMDSRVQIGVGVNGGLDTVTNANIGAGLQGNILNVDVNSADVGIRGNTNFGSVGNLGLNTGSNSLLGVDANLGLGAKSGSNSLLGVNANAGLPVNAGSNSLLGIDANLGLPVRSGSNSLLGVDANLGFPVKVGSNSLLGANANIGLPSEFDLNNAVDARVNTDLNVPNKANLQFKTELASKLLKDKMFKNIFSDFVPQNALKPIAAAICQHISKAFQVSRSFLLPLENSIVSLTSDVTPSPEYYASIITGNLSNLFDNAKFISDNTVSLQATIAANAITSALSSFIRIAKLQGVGFSMSENAFDSYFSALNGLGKLPYVGIEASTPRLPLAMKLIYATKYASKFANILFYNLISSPKYLETFTLGIPRFYNKILVVALGNFLADAFGSPSKVLFYDLFSKALLRTALNINKANFAKEISIATARALLLNGYFLSGNLDIQAAIAKNAIIRALIATVKPVSSQANFYQISSLPRVTQLEGVLPSQILLKYGTDIGLNPNSGLWLGKDGISKTKINAGLGEEILGNSGFGANINNGIGLGLNANLGKNIAPNFNNGAALGLKTDLGLDGRSDLGLGLVTTAGSRPILDGKLNTDIGSAGSFGTNVGLGNGINSGLISNIGVNAGLDENLNANVGSAGRFDANFGLGTALNLGANLGINDYSGTNNGLSLGTSLGNGIDVGSLSDVNSGLNSQVGVNTGLGLVSGEEEINYNSVPNLKRKKRAIMNFAEQDRVILNSKPISGLDISSGFNANSILGVGAKSTFGNGLNLALGPSANLNAEVTAGGLGAGVNLGLQPTVKSDGSDTSLSIQNILPLILANKLYKSTAVYTSISMIGVNKIINLISQAMASEFGLPVATIFLRSYAESALDNSDNNFENNVACLAKATTEALGACGFLSTTFSPSTANQLADAIVAKFSSLIATSLEAKECTGGLQWNELLNQDYVQPALIPEYNYSNNLLLK